MHDTFDWSSINHAAFEDMALEYVEAHYPLEGGKWSATPKSNDGNRDGELVHKIRLGDEISESLFWCEAKYIENVDTNLHKCRLDQTLVSAFFEHALRRIIFVTNGYYTESSKLRAEKFSIQARLSKPLFIDEPRISEWLTNASGVVQRYGLKKKGTISTERVAIIAINLFRKRDYLKGIWAPTRRLAIGDPYAVCLSVKAASKSTCSISFNIPGKGQQHVEAELSVGDNLVPYEFTPDAAFERVPLEVRLLCQGESRAVVCFSSPLSATGVERFDIVCASQLKAISTACDILRESNMGSSNGLLYIHGPGGAGKSRALDDIAAHVEKTLDIEVFAFDGKEHHDNGIVAQLIQYLNYGYIYKEITSTGKGVNYCYQELLNIFNSGASLLRFEGAIGEQKIAIVDDVHKLESENAELFKQLLREHFQRKNNTILICAARSGEFADEQVEEIVHEHVSKKFQISLLSSEDIGRSIRINFPHENYFQIYESVSNFTTTIHDLESFFHILRSKTKQGDMESLDIPALYSLSLGKRSFFSTYDRLSEKERLLIDFLYTVEKSIEIEFILEHFTESQLNNLIDKKYIKLVTISSEKYVRYWHDIKLEYYKANHEYVDVERLVEIIDTYTDGSEEAQLDFLPFFIKHHSKTRLRRINQAIQAKDRLISLGDFGKAASITNALVQLLCEDDGYDKYGIEYGAVLKTKHDHAMCLTHCRSSEEAKKIYQSIKDDINASCSSVAIEAVSRSCSELFNIKLRELDAKDLIVEINEYIEEKHDCMYGDLKYLYRRSVLDSYNRLMMANYLIDDTVRAKEIFDIGTTLCEEMRRTKDYAGFCLDRAKALLYSDPGESIGLIEMALQNYAITNESKRRVFVANCELAYAKVLLGNGSLKDLEAVGQDMLDARYYRGYVRTRYKCIAYHLANDDMRRCENEMTKCSHPTFVDNSKRFRFVRSHLYSVFFAKMGDVGRAMKHAKKHLELVRGLGQSYVHVARNNLRIIQEAPESKVCWSHSPNNGQAHIIDNRIW